MEKSTEKEKEKEIERNFEKYKDPYTDIYHHLLFLSCFKNKEVSEKMKVLIDISQMAKTENNAEKKKILNFILNNLQMEIFKEKQKNDYLTYAGFK